MAQDTMPELEEGVSIIDVPPLTDAPSITDVPPIIDVSPVDGTDEEKPGMVSEVKFLYQGKPDEDGIRPWVEEMPTDLVEAVENEKSARYALLIRKVKCYDGRRPLSIQSIIIQSPLIRDALVNLLDNYPGITTGINRMKIKPPFEAFVHRWHRFESILEQEEDATTKAHLQLLYNVIHEEISNDIKVRDDLIAHEVIDFDHVWMLFEPGSTIYSTRLGQPCAFRLNNCTFKGGLQPHYQLSCHFIEWNGENFGYGTTYESIYKFEGTCSIAELSAFPLKYHPDVTGVTDRLITRGKEFESLAGYHFKAYHGIAIGTGLRGQIAYNINSRVIVDTYAWNRFNPNSPIMTTPLEKEKTLATPVSEDGSEEWNYDDDEYVERQVDDLDSIKQALKVKKTTKIPKLTRNQHLLCTNTLKGYSLKDKKWLTLFVEKVQEIKWSEHAFSRLVLPGDQKELILALTESQREHRNEFEDVIQGKGMGMIMLLSGPPGVGKTLTAESVAENMRVPLYMMSAGDLGTTSHEVESTLSTVLEMCVKWKAVLLLDECDVFLEQRTAHDLERNKLVSIFLRILEYYEGILFLTSNRVEQIDKAFQSRIHISIAYNELNEISRRTVWDNLLSGSPQKNEIGKAEMDKLASFPMNGREIKNVLKTAQLLASRKKEPLKLQHVKTVLGIEKRFVVE